MKKYNSKEISLRNGLIEETRNPSPLVHLQKLWWKWLLCGPEEWYPLPTNYLREFPFPKTFLLHLSPYLLGSTETWMNLWKWVNLFISYFYFFLTIVTSPHGQNSPLDFSGVILYWVFIWCTFKDKRWQLHEIWNHPAIRPFMTKPVFHRSLYNIF